VRLNTNKTTKREFLRNSLLQLSEVITIRGAGNVTIYVTTLFLLFNNLNYSTFVSDHENYLLQFRRRIDPSFAKNDWYVEKIQEHHFIFTEILVLLSKFLTLEQTLYLLFVLNFIILSIAVGLICQKVNMGTRGFLLSMALIQLFDGNTVGGVNFLPASTLPHYLSLSLFLFSYWAHIRGHTRVLTTMIICILYINFSTGFFAIAYFNLIWIISLSKGDLKINKLILRNLIILLNVVVYLLVTNFTFIKSNVDRQNYSIFFELRAPHHYLYTFFTPTQYILTSTLLVLVYILQSKVKPQLPNLDTFVYFLIAMFVASTIATVHFLPEFLRLFPFRLFPILIPISAILVAQQITKCKSKRSLLFWNVLIFMILVVSKNRPELNPYKWQKLIEVHFLISLFLLFFVCMNIILRKYGQDWQRLMSSSSVLIIFLVTLLAFPTIKLIQNFEAYDVNGLNRMTKVIPKGATILVPPSAGEVRFLGERAIVVDYSASPLDLNFMEFWRERITQLSCGRTFEDSKKGYELWDAIAREYNRCPVSELIQIATRYQARYILLERPNTSQGKSLLVPLGEFGIYDLFRIP
jgi:hypothetical protein